MPIDNPYRTGGQTTSLSSNMQVQIDLLSGGVFVHSLRYISTESYNEEEMLYRVEHSKDVDIYYWSRCYSYTNNTESK